MKIAFLGTPEFALPSLEMLVREHHDIAVFTQPDRPRGRHAAFEAPPVKLYAQERGIPVNQFEQIRSSEGNKALSDFAPDLMVTAAFGQILSKENLSVPRFGCINVHGSLLPKYRGAAPVQWAIINGEEKTGVTTMMTDAGLDTGDILLMRETSILPDETAGELSERLAVLGAQVLKETLCKLEEGTLVRVPQDNGSATRCAMLKKEHGRIDFTLSQKQVHDLVRGVNPWPGAYAMLNGSPVKIWRTKVAGSEFSAPPGTLRGDAKKGLFVAAGDGELEILEIQFPGSRKMDAKSALMGKPLEGARLL
ncbi:MAG: Methionyl-tRNA formyltransferase [Firmicutes bacterium ADurb.Bin182]|nr:MAG: Methionyl-tRNA formyltransferase [Firmicutes bacterium ADurb.Bin182]